MASVQDVTNNFWGLPIQFATAALSSSTATATQLNGAAICVLNNSANNPLTLTTRTAAQMVADFSLSLGTTWLILLVNGQSTGTLTLAGDTGVTIVGTATVVPITARLFVAKVTLVTTPTITITNQYAFTATALAFGA